MATLVLGAAGSALGGAIGGSVLGVSAATIGGAVGSALGSAVDAVLLSRLQPAQRVEGARLDSLRVTSATEGTTVPRVFGRMRVGGNIIWATDFREERTTTSQRAGKTGPRITRTEYAYFASFAVAICEGPITGIGRVWADGKALDLTGVTLRWYPGDEGQAPDPLIEARMGAGRAPAYRGTAYAVFEELDLEAFGNRLPQLTFEVFRPLAEPDTAEGLVRAVCLIPASGEFTLATEPVFKSDVFLAGGEELGGDLAAENLYSGRVQTDFVTALDRLEASAPNLEAVSLVVAWFGTDLRLGACEVKPGVEVPAKATEPVVWEVAGTAREDAFVVSRDENDRPVYGGTPSDLSVVQAIQAIKARGWRVTFYPFMLMDVPPGNDLPDPYSDNAATLGQPAFPWRGRITVSPAAGFAGSPDKTAAAAGQVSTFFGREWGLRRMILHYAQLCADAGGVDAFLIGTEMRGLTWVRSGPSTYPAVAQLRQLAADARAILGAGCKISYAADWSEYFGHQPDDGSGDVFYHLDPLWSDPQIDFIGIDNYMPLADWRDGTAHADAQAWDAPQDRAYLTANIAGGEGFDWFYASAEDRAAQLRTPIADGAGQPWVFRYKDLVAWWSRAHVDRPGGAAAGIASVLASGEAPGGGDWTANPDTSAVPEPGLFLDRFDGAARVTSDSPSGRIGTGGAVDAGSYDVTVWFRAGSADQVRVAILNAGTAFVTLTISTLAVARQTNPSGLVTAPAAAALGGGVYRLSFTVAIPADSPALRFEAGPLPSGGVQDTVVIAAQMIPAGAVLGSATDWVPQSKPVWFTEFGCPAVDRGANQPNVFFDPKSSESFLPYFSRGWRDDAIQRSYLEATLLYWADPAHNPVSGVYGGPMLDLGEAAAWTWDARPYPWFPALDAVWSDGDNWRLGHWLNGRLGSVPLAALVRALCRRAGLADARIDVSGLWGAVEGYAIARVESPRASIAALMRHFGFDGVESGGVIRFVMRSRRPRADVALADLVEGDGGGEPLELARAQESELPQGLVWRIDRADADYEAAVVEARQPTTDTTRIVTESVPFVVAPEEAQRRVRRALAETWAGRETATFRLPPSRLALDPADPVRLLTDAGPRGFRLLSTADAGARTIEAVAEDRWTRDLPPAAPGVGSDRTGSTGAGTGADGAAPSVGPPAVQLMDLPQLREGVAAHQPVAAAWRRPWPGSIGVLRAGTAEGEDLRAVLEVPATLGVLAEPLFPGAPWRWDMGNAAFVDLLEPLASATDEAVLAGANTFAVRQPSGAWEVLQAAQAELIAPGRWRLSRLLRGQRGTEGVMDGPVPAGAPVVRLDGAVQPVDMPEGEIGLPAQWLVGPLSRPLGDAAFREVTFTPAGRGLRPFAPAHVAQPFRTARVPGDLTIRWVRRSRALSADSWELSEVPPEPDFAGWEVEVLDGASVVRTLTSGVPEVLYSGADQTADWGAPVAFPQVLRVRIFELSSRVGRGAPGVFDLFF